MGDNKSAVPGRQGRTKMADSNVKSPKARSAQAAHRVHMNPAMFRAMSQALFNLSVRELETFSPRRMLTHVLSEPGNPVFKLEINELDRICNSDLLAGSIRVNIRVDSSINDRLREFREYAEQQLGRSVSVLEAIYACIYVVSRN